MMFEFCFCAILFFVRNQNHISVMFNLSEKNRYMNKETGIKSIYCNVQIPFRWKNGEIGYY